MCWPTKQLCEKHPDKQVFKGRYARPFIGLTNEEALWLAARHNSSSFRHEMTFQDEASTTILHNGPLPILVFRVEYYKRQFRQGTLPDSPKHTENLIFLVYSIL